MIIKIPEIYSIKLIDIEIKPCYPYRLEKFNYITCWDVNYADKYGVGLYIIEVNDLFNKYKILDIDMRGDYLDIRHIIECKDWEDVRIKLIDYYKAIALNDLNEYWELIK